MDCRARLSYAPSMKLVSSVAYVRLVDSISASRNFLVSNYTVAITPDFTITLQYFHGRIAILGFVGNASLLCSTYHPRSDRLG